MKILVYTPVIVFGIFAMLFAVEKLFPLRESRTGLLARLVVNTAISGLTFLIAMVVVRPAALKALNWSSEQPFGLLHWLILPGWTQLIPLPCRIILQSAGVLACEPNVTACGEERAASGKAAG